MVKFPGYFREASRTTCLARAAINRLAHNVEAHAAAREEIKLRKAAMGVHQPIGNQRIKQTDAALENARDRLMTTVLQRVGAFHATQAYMRRAKREGHAEPFYLEKLYRDAFRQVSADQKPKIERMLQRLAFMEAAREHFGIENHRANVYLRALSAFNTVNADRIEAARADFAVTMNSFFRAAPPRVTQAEAPQRGNPEQMATFKTATA